jgi:hypothetical protein
MTLQNMGGTFLPAMITRPEFAGYLAERIFEQSRFVQSGVVARNGALDVRAGGTRIRVPEFDPIAPTIERIDSSNSWGTSGAGYLTPQALSTDEQVMTILRRGFAYSVDDVTKLGTGVADPLGHVRNQLAAAVNKAKTATLSSQLNGLFGNISGSGVLGANTVDKSGTTTATSANYLSAGNVVAAKQKLGERGSELSTVIMHSAVAAHLEETGYLQVQSNGGSVFAGGGVGSGLGEGLVARFAGLNVIVDDQIGPISGGTATHLKKYPVYIAGSGVIGEGIQQDLAVAFTRNELSFQDTIVVNWHMGYHVYGTRWAASGDNPTDAATTGNLGATGSWALAYTSAKNVPLVRLLVNTPYDTSVYA